MKVVFYNFAIILFVSLLVEVSVKHVLAQQMSASDNIVILPQKIFDQAFFERDAPLFERIHIESLDGNAIDYNQLPVKARDKLIELDSRVFPRLELKNVDPKEAIQIIIKEPKPRHMIRLGLVSDRHEQDTQSSWLRDLSFEEKRVSCTITNVSFLNLSIALAEALDLDFGVTQGGLPEFCNRVPEQKEVRRRFHLVKLIGNWKGTGVRAPGKDQQ